MGTLRRLYNVFRKLTQAVAWTIVLPFAFALSFVLSVGPHIQKYILALVNSDAASIYGSSYQESLARFVGLQTWLGMAFHWHFVAMAVLIAIYSLRYTQPRPILRATTVASLVVLTLFDVAFGIIAPQLTLEYLFVNIIANLFGGLLIGSIVILILCFTNMCFRYMAIPERLHRPTAGVIAIVVGVLASTITFYVVDFFYRPVPVALDLHQGYPAIGTIATETKYRRTQNDAKPFKFVPSGTTGTCLCR